MEKQDEPRTTGALAKSVADTEYKRKLRLGKMQAYLDASCAEFHIDPRYKARASELLVLAARVGTKAYKGSNGRMIQGIKPEAIVDALVYAVIIDESGLECPLVAAALYRHKKQHRFKIVYEVRLATGLGGRAYPVLPRAAIDQLALLPDEVEDIKAIMADPRFQEWIGVSPAGIGAAITYLYALRCRSIKVPQRAVANAFGISEVCLRARVKDITDEVQRMERISCR